MKKIGATFAGVLLAALLIAGGLSWRSAFAQTPVQQDDGTFERTIRVTGTGVSTTTPDTAVVVIGVRTEADEASAALDENSEQMEALIDALQQAGVAEADIQTMNINLSPRYNDQPDQTGQLTVTGYIASNTVQARITGIERVGAILDAAVQEGGNLIESIFFEVSDPAEAQQQAREAAFDNAVEKAQELADLAGVEIGRLVAISETTNFVPIAFGGAADIAQERAVPIQAGTQNIQISLDVTWEITGGQVGVPQTGNRTPTATVTRLPTLAITPLVPTASATAAAATATTAPPVNTATATSAVPTVDVTEDVGETSVPTVEVTDISGTPDVDPTDEPGG